MRVNSTEISCAPLTISLLLLAAAMIPSASPSPSASNDNELDSDSIDGFLVPSLSNATLHDECDAVGDSCGTGAFCDFRYEEGWPGGGLCLPCPDDPSGCFFSGTTGSPLAPKAVEACARNCLGPGMPTRFGNDCKVCAGPLEAFAFGVDDPSDACRFCPSGGRISEERRDRVVPIFDKTCQQWQDFFDTVDIRKDTKHCRFMQSFDYICECQGSSGHAAAGGSTKAKQKALVWGPRITSILSLLGSLYVVCDCLRGQDWRNNTFYQLMIQLSFFDVIGSIAYMLTSLPMPSEFYYYGARGNDATCVAQGFFIQIGTISCFTNVSLAVYYYLVINKGLNDTGVQKIKRRLLACPMVAGLVFAFAGIPFYDDTKLWCNNTARWWPDIPVAIALVVTTCIMGVVCWGVYRKEEASKKWRGPGATNHLSSKVFWQSFWFLMAFYMTWPPYLALQYSWALGRSFTDYDFILYAGLVVPMQGFWNSFVYARNRGLKVAARNVRASLKSGSSRGTSFLKSLRFSRSLERRSATQPNSVVDKTSGIVQIGECADIEHTIIFEKISECTDAEHPENFSRALTKLALGEDLEEVKPF